ncbi:MAG: Ig-like domain-containing protein [Bacteroidales bacterium]|nr:Ig-like domain-containing protein [Bacteroidales bacterium]
MTTKAFTNRTLAAQGCLYIATALLLFAACGKDTDLPEDIDIKDVAGISVTPSSLTLKAGESKTLSASITPAAAADIATVIWAGAPSAVAEVDNAGNLLALLPGAATITASAGGKSASCNLTVEKPDVAFTQITAKTANPLTTTKGTGVNMVNDTTREVRLIDEHLNLYAVAVHNVGHENSTRRYLCTYNVAAAVVVKELATFAGTPYAALIADASYDYGEAGYWQGADFAANASADWSDAVAIARNVAPSAAVRIDVINNGLSLADNLAADAPIESTPVAEYALFSAEYHTVYEYLDGVLTAKTVAVEYYAVIDIHVIDIIKYN